MSGTMDEQELRADLPWLVNGSLPPARRAEVQAGVDASPALQQELAFLEHLRRAVRDDSGKGPGELGWRRLRRQIDSDAIAKRQQRQGLHWRGLAVAASVLAVLQLGWMVVVLPREQAYEPMAAAPEARAGTVIQLRFRANAPMAQVEAMLARHGLRVVDGPGVAGVWRVQIREGDLARALQALQAERSLVEFAAQE